MTAARMKRAINSSNLSNLHKTIKNKSSISKPVKCPSRQPTLHDVELADDAMFAYFRKSPAVQQRCDVLKNTLLSYGMSAVTTSYIIRDVFDALLVPASVKAHTRGMLFNSIVARELTDVCNKRLYLDPERFNLCFEVPSHIVSEIPDWMIHDKLENRTLIGFNQIDLWCGGHQLNRGSKYVLDNSIHDRLANDHKSRLIAVVAQDLPEKTRKGSKVSKMKEHIMKNTGSEKARLCLARDLEAIVKSWSFASENDNKIDILKTICNDE